MNSLTFKGQIASGGGSFSKMVIPGRDSLKEFPANWPLAFASGSLNVQITPDGMPTELKALGGGHGLQRLEAGRFPPCLQIKHSQIKNNRLSKHRPINAPPQFGDAQVWTAELIVNSVAPTPILCWVMRRIGASYKDILEIISDVNLKEKHRLTDGMIVSVVIHKGKSASC
jgi:hypothetical protein